MATKAGYHETNHRYRIARFGQEKDQVGGASAWHSKVSAATAALLLLCIPLFLGACAASSYAGILLNAGTVDPELQDLALRAHAGDKHAQLELGIRYEEGLGVPINHDRAEQLYRAAASDSGEPLYVYSPPVGQHGRGRVLPVRNESAWRGLPEAQARLAALANADEGSSSTAPVLRSHPRASAAFTVGDFFPSRLVDGQCGQLAGLRSLSDLSVLAEAGGDEDPPDLDCYPIEPPQWPAPEGRSAWFYLLNLRNFLAENDLDLTSHSLSSILQSSGLLRVEQDKFAIYSIMALAMAKQEAGCAIYLGRLAYTRGLYSAFDDTMKLLNRIRGASAQCAQPEVAQILAGARPEMREVPIPSGEAANPFAAYYFPRSLLDGRCFVAIDATAMMQGIDDLNRNFSISAPPDLDCYRTSEFAWPAPALRTEWFYLGNLLGFLNHVRGRIADHSLEDIISSSRVLEGNPNGYVFYVIMRLLEAEGETGCAVSFARLAYENGSIEANAEFHALLRRSGGDNVGVCKTEELKSIIADHGVRNAQ
ncbi:SEL1-like repeat protein [Sphingosinicella sp. CPCC 101087]|uniref:SEL1-like repeat protein n=1 Tax=Sphingosinicella sp. CPCC 101087 TaxID=2497754 RepID=UPI00101BE3B9|nr:SEL1-like repeat protein [Sphingosinicella sp. CPCC 101087]